MLRPDDVNAYIAVAPQPVRGHLNLLRDTILQAAPDAEERISYGMPHYHYRGPLAYFGLQNNHIGLYIPPPVIAEHADELKGYKTAKATVQLPLDQEIPVALVRRLITARARKNEESAERGRRGQQP